MTASGNGYKTVSVSLPSKYAPSTNTHFIGASDFSAQFAIGIELKTDCKLYITATYYSGMNSYGVARMSGMLYL